MADLFFKVNADYEELQRMVKAQQDYDIAASEIGDTSATKVDTRV